MADLLRDIGTLSELWAWSERLEVARLLGPGKTYRQVAELTGASTTTVTRVARFLRDGEGGYRRVLKAYESPRGEIRPPCNPTAPSASPSRSPDACPRDRLHCCVEWACSSRPIRTGCSSPCRNMPIDVLFLRDDDIPEYVEDGVADLGIVGSNVLEERAVRLERLLPLDFGFCSLCLAAPEQGDVRRPRAAARQTDRHPLPRTLGRYLRERQIAAEVVVLKGCVEIAPGHLRGRRRDLRPRFHGEHASHARPRILEHRRPLARRCSSGGRTLLPPRRELIDRLLLRARGVQEAQKYKYIMFNAPAEAIGPIKELLPGCKSPTVVPLAEPGYVAVHSMVLEERFGTWWRKSRLWRNGHPGDARGKVLALR